MDTTGIITVTVQNDTARLQWNGRGFLQDQGDREASSTTMSSTMSWGTEFDGENIAGSGFGDRHSSLYPRVGAGDRGNVATYEKD